MKVVVRCPELTTCEQYYEIARTIEEKLKSLNISSNIVVDDLDTDEEEFDPYIKIKKEGSVKEYLDRVDHWYSNIPKSYLENLKKTYPNLNIEKKLEDLQKWQHQWPERRKTMMNAFVRKCLSKDQKRFELSRKGSYQSAGATGNIKERYGV